MSSAEITKVVIAVEIEGATYFVDLPLNRMMILIKMASGLSDSGALPVVKAPDGYKFEVLGA